MSPAERGHGNKRWGPILATVAVATVLVGGTSLVQQVTEAPSGPPPTAGTANIWMDTNGGTCTRSSTPRAYTGAGDAASCGSLVAAYNIASSGDLVLIRSGSYGSPGAHTPRSLASPVVFRADDGASITISSLYDWGASNTVIDGQPGDINVPGGFRIKNPSNNNQVSNITLQYLDTQTQSEIDNASNVTLRGNEIGFWCDTNGSNGEDSLRFNDTTGAAGDSGDPTNILVEGNTIGEMCWRNDPSPHPDCVAMSAGNNVTFRGNKFYECASQGLYLISELGGNIHDVTIENNWFGDCSSPGGFSNCANSLILDVRSPGLSNITVRHNSWAVGAQPMRVSGGTSASNIQVRGNAGEGPGCESPGGGVTYANNVWDDITCAASDTLANPGFVNNSSGSALDLHLSSTSSPACNRGGATFPTVDYDNESRPQGSAVEAGADEKVGC